MLYDPTGNENQAQTIFKIAKLQCSDVHPMDQIGLFKAKFYCGYLLFGYIKSTYSLTLSLAQFKQAALLFMEGCANNYAPKVVQSSPVGSFERYMNLMSSLCPVILMSCQVEVAALQDYISTVCGDLDVRARETFQS
jgi:hypothetical protein